MADIDHFKLINDTHGHPAGDRVLTEIAGIFSDTLRMPDKVGRYGGEEFLVILPHTTLAGGRKIAEAPARGGEPLAVRDGWQGSSLPSASASPRRAGRGYGAVAGAR